MIKPGMFISDRYEIIDKVGSGGMADVYKAKCHRLNRFVAIKILKPDLSNNSSFVTKFRGEAQSVAGLSHPNIVSVYDVGDDGDLHYIVMELVEGITLKRFIERKGRLEIKEAVGIAIQIAQGLAAAHTNHIVHRDIKPQNIIISRDGKVKVADFGIAKAATADTVSQNAVGSVHYLSPEQARGGYSDERSDIYSLGVTLYEMLAGQVPFTGENSVSVALSHIQSEAAPIRSLNPDVPVSIDKIVQKCMFKKPERRYQTASDVIRDLKRSIINPDGEYVNMTAVADYSNAPTIKMNDEEMDYIKHGSAASKRTEVSEPVSGKPQGRSSGTQKNRNRDTEDELDRMNPTTEKIVLGVVAVLIIVLAVVLVMLFKRFFGTGKDQQPQIPDMPTPAATEVVEPTPTKTPIITSEPEKDPEPKKPENPDDNQVQIKNVVGWTKDSAAEYLKSISDKLVIKYNEEYSDDYPDGFVSEQSLPANVYINLDEINEITLTISVGKDMEKLKFELADYADADGEQAVKKMEKLELVTTVVTEQSGTVEKGKVIRTIPAAGETVLPGDTITVYVSEGIAEELLVEIPSFVGRSLSDARDIAAKLGLNVANITMAYSEDYDADVVTNQNYSVGDRVAPGTSIDLTVSMGSLDDGGSSGNNEPDDGGSGSSGEGAAGGEAADSVG